MSETFSNVLFGTESDVRERERLRWAVELMQTNLKVQVELWPHFPRRLPWRLILPAVPLTVFQQHLLQRHNLWVQFQGKNFITQKIQIQGQSKRQFSATGLGSTENNHQAEFFMII